MGDLEQGDMAEDAHVLGEDCRGQRMVALAERLHDLGFLQLRRLRYDAAVVSPGSGDGCPFGDGEGKGAGTPCISAFQALSTAIRNMYG